MNGATSMTPTKTCTACGQTLPITEFYIKSRSDPDGPRKARCKACDLAAARKYRENGPSLDHKIRKELVEHGTDNPDALSPEVREAVFTDEPIPPELLALHEKRRKAEARREKQRERERIKRERNQPMLWGGQGAFA
ncbi:MAG: hypothetical protein AAFP15_08560 [Bacteroidota bacterium]